jgi:hypothetical protein
MKYLILILFLTSFTACNHKEIVSINLTLIGMDHKDSIIQIDGKNYSKRILTHNHAIIKDTLHVDEPGFYFIKVGRKGGFNIFLNKGYHLKIEGNLKNIQKTLQFEGKGSQPNAYLLKRYELLIDFRNKIKNKNAHDSIFVKQEYETFKTKMESLLIEAKIDTFLYNYEKAAYNDYKKKFESFHNLKFH